MRLINKIASLALAALLGAALVLGFGQRVWATEATLNHVSTSLDQGLTLPSSSHYVAYDSPAGWPNCFSQSLEFYCQRYGDVSGIKGIVVFYQAPTDKTDITTPYTILGRKLFDLSSAPEQAGWLKIPLDPIELPPHFGVAIFTYSNEQRGLKVWMTQKLRESISNSSVMKPDGTLDRKFKPNVTREGREWLIKLTLRDSLDPQSAISSSELSGSSFGFHDDGSAETFVSVQKHGCLVHFKNSKAREVSHIYVYGKAEGDWLKAKQNIAVSILDNEMGILQHTTIPYTAFTNIASWVEVAFQDTNTPAEFYVLVEPNSRPMAQFLVGTDTSGTNGGSSWAVIGAHLDWESDAPADKSNFMVRVKYN